MKQIALTDKQNQFIEEFKVLCLKHGMEHAILGTHDGKDGLLFAMGLLKHQNELLRQLSNANAAKTLELAMQFMDKKEAPHEPEPIHAGDNDQAHADETEEGKSPTTELPD
jgi:hypothetical protein